MMGFVGPKDIFRNPEAIFRLNEPTDDTSPFDLLLGQDGDDFSVMGMHFKLGLYEHQSAGAIEGILKLIQEGKFVEHNNFDNIANIEIKAYEPAFGIIGDPAKKSPSTRQSADHSMAYIISTLIRKAIEQPDLYKDTENLDNLWKRLMLEPNDYGAEALFNKGTRNLMDKITFSHGGEEYDKNYPLGIPTSLIITMNDGSKHDSKMVLFPSGHAKNESCSLEGILAHKFKLLGSLALKSEDLETMLGKLHNLENLNNQELQGLYNCNIQYASKCIDSL